MAVDSTATRTLRAVLTGALGAAAAMGIDAIARPERAEAVDYVVLGAVNTETYTTTITNSSGGTVALFAHGGGNIYGVAGSSQSGTGVEGQSTSGIGVSGLSNGNFGVIGVGSIGVQGVSIVDNQPGTVGWSGTNSTGLLGYSNDDSGDLPAAPARTGVYGRANQGSNAVGVHGDSPLGTGISGSSSSGFGSQGISGSGIGVYGQSFSNLAIYGYNLSSGTAILGYGQGGEGVRGHTTGGTKAAIVGHAYGGTTGVAGVSGGGNDPALPLNTGVYGHSSVNASSVGVRGESTTGRGGVFKGSTAQLRLMPSGATTHPHSGALGDLFLDKNKRLWFCKGGTTWKQLA